MPNPVANLLQMRYETRRYSAVLHAIPTVDLTISVGLASGFADRRVDRFATAPKYIHF